MAHLIRAFDWSTTATGPMEDWSESLLCSVNIMLNCRFPSLIFCGAEMVQLYNDDFIPLLAERHPSGLGQTAKVCWAEAWHLIGPRLESVMHGESVYQADELVPILRNGRLEDVRWTYSYSPIFSADGSVLGILVVCQDITRESKAVQRLQESEAQARRVLGSIGDAVIVTDTEARILSMNAVAEHLTGWAQEDARGAPLSDVFRIVNETTRLPVQNPVDKVKRTGAVAGLANHTILVASTGRETAIDDSGAPILDKEGRLTGVVLVFRDIEERRAAERERERLVEQLNQVLSATTDAVVIVNRNWTVTYLNRRARELYASERNILGKNLWEEFPKAYFEGSPYVDHYTRGMNGITSSFESFYPEPLNMWLRIDVFPTSDGIATFSRDITQEREDRESLRSKSEQAERQRAEIEALYRTAPIGLALFDAEEFRYLRLNDRQAAFFGMKPEQIVGRTLTEMAPIPGLRELFEEVRDGKPVINFPLEGSLVTHPDEHRHWMVSYFPVLAADGTVQGITASSLEVTHQKKTERALIQSEKLAVVGRLAASIAHEINNPLESVTNLLYLAQASTDPHEIKDYLDQADRELRRVSVIANQTLRFHKQSTKPTEISCDALLNSVVSLYQGRITNSGLQVEERRRPTAPVLCFEGEIRQVLSNLVGNAIDAMQAGGGRLVLRTRNSTDTKTGRRGIAITVADTGTGMPREVLNRIFEPFFTTKDIGGTGLGLWISKEIVERHKGALRVKSSQQPGCSGTVFSIWLPHRDVGRESLSSIAE